MTFSFRRMIEILAEHEVEFMVVGGLAGVLQGAPVNTQDLDILYSLQSPNPERLLSALQSSCPLIRGNSRTPNKTVLRGS